MSTTSVVTTGLAERLNAELATASAEQVVSWAADAYGAGLALACSFSAEDVALVDMLWRLTDSPNVFFLDTGRLHQETYDVLERVRDRYGIRIQTYFPQTQAVEELMRNRGANSFYASVADRKECCRIRKVEPLSRALEGSAAWMTGLRREQSPTRAGLSLFERDEAHGGILKISPLLEWSQDQVWSYIRANNVPYNELHDRGYPSIGCVPCTRPVQPGEDIRAGRWWWEPPEHKECGLHIADGEVSRR